MIDGYQRHKNEILAAISLAVPVAISYLVSLQLDENFLSKIPFLVLIAGYVAIASRLFLTERSRRSLLARSLSRVPGEVTPAGRYGEPLAAATECYYFLGMSAEEFQREINIHDYFQSRQKEGKRALTVRVLLLHPDSQFFSTKLRDVNPGADLQVLIERKKEIMKTLVASFASVPRALGNFEVRFFDDVSIWSMQLYDSNPHPSGLPDTIRVMPQIRGRHGKYSGVYELDDGDADLFGAFLAHFEGLWSQALPMQSENRFPDLFSAMGQRITTIAFDFDGTLVDTGDAKERAFRAAMQTIDGLDENIISDCFTNHRFLNRVEQLRRSYADAMGSPPPESKLAELVACYSSSFREQFSSSELFPGFNEFHDRFQHRYRFLVVSNAPQDELVEMCESLGIATSFLRIYGYPISKPAALREVSDEFGIDPSSILFVGDRPEDGMVAESVGTKFCRLNPSGADPSSGASSVHSLAELAAVVYDLDLGIVP